MKLCKDCASYDLELDRCTKVVVLSPIDGTRIWDSGQNNPRLQREDDWFMAFMNGMCGQSARWWKPRHGQD